MSSFIARIISFFRTEKVKKFDADTDTDVQRWRSIRRDVRDSRSQRREQWHERNALERELLGSGKR